MAYDSSPSTTETASASFNRIMRPYLEFLRRLALRLTRNPHDSEDLLQDVMLKLYRQRDRLEGVQVLQPWLARVMYYHHIDQRRRRPPDSAFISLDHGARGAAGSDPEDTRSEPRWDLPDDGPGPETETQGDELSAFVSRALDQLPAGQCQLVLLHDVKGLTLHVVSGLTGLPVNTVKSGLKQARKALRTSLRGAGLDAGGTATSRAGNSRIGGARLSARQTATEWRVHGTA